jgi:superfamily II DNA or RNA helicase
MSGLTLRVYQELLITDAANAFRSARRVLAVAPTGSGKTVVFCEVTRRTQAKGKRLVLIAHRIEIVPQISRGRFPASASITR